MWLPAKVAGKAREKTLDTLSRRLPLPVNS